MKEEFEVRSSDGISVYIVEFSLETSKLQVFCGCPAGVLGKWCKHKMQLISGDFSEVLGSTQVAGIDEVKNWVRNSEFPRLLVEMKLADEEMQAAKTRLDIVKKILEKSAKKGVTV